MKQTLKLQWTSSEILEDPHTLELNLTEEIIGKIRKYKNLAKEEFVSVNMPFYDYKFFNEEGGKFEEWRADVSYLKISEFGVVFYAQNKWDSSHQIETEYINL